MPKTIAEINERIRKGQAVVVTAEEIIELLRSVPEHRPFQAPHQARRW